jgi:IS5 family transposase
MVGLHLIKHMDGLSDAAVCARFLDSPYVQLCCGESHVQHALPRDRSSMTRWRQRNRAERLELLLTETLAAAQRAAAAPAARGPRPREDLRAARPGGGVHRRAPAALRRNAAGNPRKGKARTRFEFGCKVSLATTNRPASGGKVVLGARTLPGNPCDGHTLAAEIAQIECITGVTIERASVDRGDRGHDAQDRRSGEAHQSRVFVSGQRCGVTPTIRREIRRRAGIEPVISHMKADGHLGRNVLAGAVGDAIDLVLAVAGHTLRLLRAWLARLLAFLLSLLAISATAPPLPSPWLAAR